MHYRFVGDLDRSWGLLGGRKSLILTKWKCVCRGDENGPGELKLGGALI